MHPLLPRPSAGPGRRGSRGLAVHCAFMPEASRVRGGSALPIEEIAFKLDLVPMRKEGVEGRLNFLKAITRWPRCATRSG